MPRTRLSSSRSQDGSSTPRRRNSRGSRSVCSPTPSNASGRLTAIIDQFKIKNMDSFAISPMNRQSVLTDSSTIDQPQRKSWWKNLNDNSHDLMELLEGNDPRDYPLQVINDTEYRSETRNSSPLELPESSDNESIHSIVLPQRKLFTQKENKPNNNFAELMAVTEIVTEQQSNSTFYERTITIGTKTLFQGTKKSKSTFSAGLPNKYLNRTSIDTTVENIAVEPKMATKNIFGNRTTNKRKNVFDEFTAPDSEHEETIAKQSKMKKNKNEKLEQDQVSACRDNITNIEQSKTINIEDIVNQNKGDDNEKKDQEISECQVIHKDGENSRKLSQSQIKSGLLVRESMTKLHETNISHDDNMVTAVDTTMENVSLEPKVIIKDIFGNKPINKHKNIFDDFVVPDSEHEETIAKEIRMTKNKNDKADDQISVCRNKIIDTEQSKTINLEKRANQEKDYNNEGKDEQTRRRSQEAFDEAEKNQKLSQPGTILGHLVESGSENTKKPHESDIPLDGKIATVVDTTVENISLCPKITVKNIFGNGPSNKRKNIFDDFIMPDSEHDVSEIQTVVDESQLRHHTKDKKISNSIHSEKDDQKKDNCNEENDEQITKYQKSCEKTETNKKLNQCNTESNHLVHSRESIDKLRESDFIHDEEIATIGTKNLFGNTKRSTQVFSSTLLHISPNKAAADKTEGNVDDLTVTVKSIFGNRSPHKHRNIFADFIMSESENEISEIQDPEKEESRPTDTQDKERENPDNKTKSIHSEQAKQQDTLVEIVRNANRSQKDEDMNPKLNIEQETRTSQENIVSQQVDKDCNESEDEEMKYDDSDEEVLEISASQEKHDNESEEDEEIKYAESDAEVQEASQEKKHIKSQDKNEINVCIEFKVNNKNNSNDLKKTNEILIEAMNGEEDKNHSQSYKEKSKVQQNVKSQEHQSQGNAEIETKIVNNKSKSDETKGHDKLTTEVKEIDLDKISTELDNDEAIKRADNDHNNSLEVENESEGEQEIFDSLDADKAIATDELSDQGDQEDMEVDVSENEDVEDEENEFEDEENEVENVENEVEDDENEVEDDENEVEDDENEVEDDENEVESDENEVEDAENEVENEQHVVKDNEHEVEDDENEVESNQNEGDEDESKLDDARNESVDASDGNEIDYDENSEDGDDNKVNDDDIEDDNNEVEDDENVEDDNENEEYAVNEESEEHVTDNENEENVEGENEENVEGENEENVDDENKENTEVESSVIPSEEVIDESPNDTYDTTGRHRNKMKSPEVARHDKTKHDNSFVAKGRNTSIREIKTLYKDSNIKPVLAPPRDSIGLSAADSSAEGSGWDSHRTTRKTLRQTFGKDFTPRKSLRALVMEKSAKQNVNQQTLPQETILFPQANSTEYPQDSVREDDVTMDSDHEVSRRERLETLKEHLQKIKQQNIERKLKTEQAIRDSLKAPTQDSMSLFRVPSKPPPKLKLTATKPKKRIKSTLFGELPSELIEDMKYKPPKRFQPSNAAWITKRLYKFLETKLEPKYDYKARVRAEKLVESIYHFAKEVRRHDVAAVDSVDMLKHEFARLDIVKTHYEFYEFFHEYMPREIRIKVVPDVVNKIPLPRHGVFTNILKENAVQGTSHQ